MGIVFTKEWHAIWKGTRDGETTFNANKALFEY